MEQSTTSTAAASSEGGGKNPLIPNGFSELEMNAVELLVQLSGSSASAEYSYCDTNNGGDEYAMVKAEQQLVAMSMMISMERGPRAGNIKCQSLKVMRKRK